MRALAALLSLSLFSACAAVPPAAPRTEVRLEGAKLALLYASIERKQREQSRFRTDYDPVDAPYDEAVLTKNFVHVAQRSETQTVGNEVLVQGESVPLTRWEQPVRLWTSGTTPRDTAHLDALIRRIKRLTGLPVGYADNTDAANLFILISNADERQELVEQIDALERGTGSPLVRAWPDLPEFPCIARVFIDPETNTLQWAMIFIKAELSGDFRRSCLTEEFVQSLGLFNDGPEIRPSIFNDDAEFIELTRHDEYLLQILYDRRLKPGMMRSESEPIVREIAAELLAEAGS